MAERRPGQLVRALVVALSVVLLAGCTQQLAQRSQNSWLEKNQAQTLYKTSLEDAKGPLQGDVTTVLSGYLESGAIGELSGLAPSISNPGVFWAINDSGNRAELFALDRTGRHIGTFRLPERNLDWEDLASFELDGKSWLAIADTGDNLRRRSQSVLYLLQEPVLQIDRHAVNAEPVPSANEPEIAAATIPAIPETAIRKSAGTADTLTVHAKIEFSYQDGPQNVESIAVSNADKAIYLVAKRGPESSIYQLPLTLASSSKPLTAKRLGNTSGLRWADGDSWLERTLGTHFLLGPTAMDISPDNQLAVIANYRHLYLYRKQHGQTWADALRGEPRIISSHRMAQSESVAFSANSDFIIVGSEGLHAPVLLVR